MMTDEQFAEIHERLTNGEYPQPMVVLRDAQALADEVERLKGTATSPAATRDIVHVEGPTGELVVLLCSILEARPDEGAASAARRVVDERNRLAEQNHRAMAAASLGAIGDVLGMARPGEPLLESAKRVVAERDKLAEVHNEQTEQLRMLREEMEASAAAARAELCDVRAERDMLARAVETARTAGPAIDAEFGDTEALAIDVFVTGIVTGTDEMAYRLEDITDQTQDFGRPRKAAAEISVRLPAKGDLATERAQWLAARFRRPVVVTFSDAPAGAEGGQ